MHRRWARWTTPIMLLRYLVAITSATAFLTSITAIARTDDIRNAQIATCKKVGEPLRRVVIGTVFDQIHASHDAALYAKIFPDADKQALNRAITRTNAVRLRRIAPLLHVPSCEDRY